MAIDHDSLQQKLKQEKNEPLVEKGAVNATKQSADQMRQVEESEEVQDIIETLRNTSVESNDLQDLNQHLVGSKKQKTTFL